MAQRDPTQALLAVLRSCIVPRSDEVIPAIAVPEHIIGGAFQMSSRAPNRATTLANGATVGVE